jgi:predicted DNA-binding transcriptional regulator YafY
VAAKIGAVLPASLKPRPESLALVAPPTARRPEARIDVTRLRQATRAQHKVEISYRSEAGDTTERTIWPMTLAFFPPVSLCAGWCELRQDFRSFRVDRIDTATFTDERYPQEPGKRLIDYLRRVRRDSH